MPFRAGQFGGELQNPLEMLESPGQVKIAKRLPGRFEMTLEGLAEHHPKPAAAAPFVDPVVAPADRTIPLERRPAVPAAGGCGLASDRRELGHAGAMPAAHQGVFRGPVRRRGGYRGRSGRARKRRDRSKITLDAEPPADLADQSIGAIGGNSGRRGFLDQDPMRPRVEAADILEREGGQALERFFGLERQGSVIALASFCRGQV